MATLKTWLARAVVALAGCAALALPALAQQMAVDQATKFEAGDALPVTAFYDAPANLAATRPGGLLRRQDFRGYVLPKGARAVRILYHSEDADGADVASSAVVLIPAGAAPAGGWPVIVWAHGTAGVARQCAPSLMKDVYYGDLGLMPMVKAGYAVVAVDYHGLGTAGAHQYLAKSAHAADVVFAVPAARAAVPELGPRWVVDGHSQGGLAAWAVAELEAHRHDPGYLGAVAVAPPSHLDDILAAPPAAGGASFYLEYMAFALQALTPSFQPSDMLTGVALSRYRALSSRGCFYLAEATFAGDRDAPVLRSGWETTPAAKRFFAEAAIGQAPIAGPLLVVAGDADQTVPIEAVRTTVKGACALGVTLELRVYAGLDHDPTMDKSTPDQLAWIAARFAGAPAKHDCGSG
jgi:pimeloyl-ACP methyl ester carboxylesterase